MTRDEALERLRRDNPNSRPDDLTIYADAWQTYREAADNIAKNGAVCQHPRTGQPIDNPYIKVQSTAMASLQKLKRVKNVRALWE